MFTEKDKTLLAARGVSEETVKAQLDRFRTGFPYLRLAGSATVNYGILRPDEQLEHEATERWDKFLADGATVCKFVPASARPRVCSRPCSPLWTARTTSPSPTRP